MEIITNPTDTAVLDQVQVHEGPSIGRRIAFGLMAGAILVAPACGDSDDTDDTAKTNADKTAAEVLKGCEADNIEFENVASNPSKYETTAFLPKTSELKDEEAVRGYVNSLFNENGPLGTKIDRASLAAVWAVFTQ